MRKKNLVTKFFVAAKWAFLVAVVPGLIPACKDYDDDISRLEQKIQANSDNIADILALVEDGSFVQTVEATTTGIKITFSDGNVSYINNGTNGAPGAPGSVCTIVNGYWYIDGVNTGVKAQGENGTNGTNGTNGDAGAAPTIGEDGYWYINGVKTTTKAQGDAGVNGLNGTNGTNGTDGAKGDKGDTGANGTNGTNGTDGANGTNGTNGAAGQTPYVGTDGYWYLPSATGGAATKMTDGNGNFIKAAGDVVSIVDGYWAINGVKSAVHASGGIIALLNEQGTYYTITVFNPDGTSSSITVPAVSGEVTGLVLIPNYVTTNGTSVIYIPYINVDVAGVITTVYSAPAVSYWVNPSAVKESAFEVDGFYGSSSIIIGDAAKKRAAGYDDYIEATKVDYGNYGLLVVTPTDPGSMINGRLYSLGVMNKTAYSDSSSSNEEAYVQSNYATVRKDEAKNITVGSSSLEDYMGGTDIATIDTFVKYRDSITVRPISYFSPSAVPGTRLDLSDFFAVSYTFGAGSNDKFLVKDNGDGSAKIKLRTISSLNIGEITIIPVTMSVKVGGVVKYTKAVNLSVIATEDTPTPTPANFRNKSFELVLGDNAYSLDTFLNVTVNYLFDISVETFNSTAVTYADSLYKQNNLGQYVSLTNSNIQFNGTKATTDVKLLVGPFAAGTNAAPGEYLNPGSYKFTRTYTYTRTVGGVVIKTQKIASYLIKINPSIAITIKPNFWSDGKLNIYGHESGANWVMDGNMSDGFAKYDVNAPTAGAKLEYVSTHFALVTPDGDNVTTPANVTYTSSYWNINSLLVLKADSLAALKYITNGTNVPVKIWFKVIASGNYYYIEGDITTFNAIFKSPITVAGGSTISFKENANTASLSPFDGIVIRNDLTNTQLTNKAQLDRFGIVGSSALVDPDDVTRRLRTNWFENVNNNFGYGNMTWWTTGGAEGTALITPLLTEWDVTIKTAWKQYFHLPRGLKITVLPLAD